MTSMGGADHIIVVVGAGGLIGQAVAEDLRLRGFRIVGLARRFSAAQVPLFDPDGLTAPLVELDVGELTDLLARSRADIVVNCLGVLQDGPGSSTRDVHVAFVGRLIEAVTALPAQPLLVHLSMPGREEDDVTAFAATKRQAERAIVASGVPHLILRPGFVIAPAAYGGSALIRALAMLPVDLPRDLAAQPFAATAVADIAATIAWATAEREAGREVRAVWDVCASEPTTVGDVVAAFRKRLGGPRPLFRVPNWAMSFAARAGDLAAWLGWSPPIRSTALAEMRRGVVADPTGWMTISGQRPTPLAEAMEAVAVSVQERWFARLYLAKPLVMATLALFWFVSGLIALTVAFWPARAVLVGIGLPEGLAGAVTVATSLVDIAIGFAIAHRRTCRLGLATGILVAAGYVLASAILAPGLWLDPLGAMVKTVPAIVLMLIALLLLDSR